VNRKELPSHWSGR